MIYQQMKWELCFSDAIKLPLSKRKKRNCDFALLYWCFARFYFCYSKNSF